MDAPQVDNHSSDLTNNATTNESGDPIDLELRVESSQPFVGRWNTLISQTNWEKGRIILEWRNALIEEGAPATSYSDEAWSRLVGSITSQHVGRLRRAYQRFGESYSDYEGIYWSHFQAGLDWEDAELWLEGAVQNKWSVSQMRRQRWETLGADPALKPQDRDVITAEIDEDFEPLADLAKDAGNDSRSTSDDFDGGPRHEGPDFGEESSGGATRADGAKIYAEGDENSIEFVRPFENLAELPEDVSDAFDAYKLAIIRHKAAEWSEISLSDMLASLDALKELAKAPAQA